jgi:hypothetical protein
MAASFKCDACGNLFEGRPGVAELSAGAVGNDADGTPPTGTAPAATGRREVHAIECAIYLLGRLSANGELARQRLDEALTLGRVETPAPAA